MEEGGWWVRAWSGLSEVRCSEGMVGPTAEIGAYSTWDDANVGRRQRASKHRPFMPPLIEEGAPLQERLARVTHARALFVREPRVNATVDGLNDEAERCIWP